MAGVRVGSDTALHDAGTVQAAALHKQDQNEEKGQKGEGDPVLRHDGLLSGVRCCFRALQVSLFGVEVERTGHH